MSAFALPPSARFLAPRALLFSSRRPSLSRPSPTRPSPTHPSPTPPPHRHPIRASASATPSPPSAPTDEIGQTPSVVDGASGGEAWLAEVASVSASIHCGDLAAYAEQRTSGLTAPAAVGVGEFSDTWALSVASRKAFELRNQYSRVGIEMEMNFPDFVPVSAEAADLIASARIEAVAAAKARAVYFATGLPAIAEVHEMIIEAPESGSRVNKTLQTGYRTRDVEAEGDSMIERVAPISDENRRVVFLSAVVYFDGESEILTRGRVDVAIVFGKARRCSIAVSAALDNLYMELTRRLGLKLVPPKGEGREEVEDKGMKLVGATLLRERIMREGEMLDGGIVKVSSFLNHMVDTELMEACGIELAQRLRKLAPTKVLTVESTGLIIGLPTARHLNVPLVFARKSRPIAISDSFQTTYRSATKGTSSDLIVSCDYLSAGDRVIIIDDFLAGGSTAEALFKLVNMARAKIVGVGVAIEKMSDGGRSFLSGYNVPVESLAKVLPGNDAGRVDVMEEDPWQPPEAARNEEAEYASAKIRTARETAARRLQRIDSNSGLQGDGDVIEGGEDGAGEYEYDEDDEEDDDVYHIDLGDEDSFDQLQDDMLRDTR